MKTVYIARHGETVTAGRFCGVTDAALSDQGKRQSTMLVASLLGQGVRHIITTGLQRTDYCGLLATQKHVPHKIETQLQEVNFGAWEGLEWSEISAQYPDESQSWLTHPARMHFPKGESMENFYARVQRGWKKVVQLPEEKVAIVAHAGVAGFLFGQLGVYRDSPLAYGEVVVVPLPQ